MLSDFRITKEQLAVGKEYIEKANYICVDSEVSFPGFKQFKFPVDFFAAYLDHKPENMYVVAPTEPRFQRSLAESLAHEALHRAKILDERAVDQIIKEYYYRRSREGR